MDRSSERGVAMVAALLLILMVSLMGSSLMFMARAETTSSMSYTAMSQVRYGAESGVHAAANHLLNGYTPPGGVADPITNYDLTVSPVEFNGAPVVLSSDPASASNYPDEAARDAFVLASQGTLDVSGRQVTYNARATLVSMRQINDHYTGIPITLQTWEIVGTGSVVGNGASVVEVEATIERPPVPVFSYATFATHDGCEALSFAGGANTDSYDSGELVGGAAVFSDTGGNVGTNGNLDGNGNPTTINGTLSTPRAGIGNCTSNNVTAATIAGWGTVEEGLVTLPQPIDYPTPAAPDPVPPTSNTSFNAGGCPAANPPLYCAASAGGSTITPPSASTIVTLGNVSLQGGAIVHLNAGVYHFNSLKLTGNAQIKIDSGPVIIKIAGQDEATPLDLAGGGVSNPSLDPTQLQFVYGGTGNIKITGGTDTAALVYAPNASSSLHGNSTHFYGAIVTNKVTATGGVNIHYDRRLGRTVFTAGNPTMTGFSWRSF